MKIVRSIKDITGYCWCRLTEENFNAVKKLGLKTSLNSFEKYSKNPNFEETDIFYICTDSEMSTDWVSGRYALRFLEIKFELSEQESNTEPKNSLTEY